MSDELHIDEITLINTDNTTAPSRYEFPKKSSAFSVIIGGNGQGNRIYGTPFTGAYSAMNRTSSRENTSIISNKYIKEQHKNKMAMSVQIVMASGNKKYRDTAPNRRLVA